MLRVYIKPPGGLWVEYTPVLRPDRSFEIGGRAYNGEADQGEITVDDPDYTLDVYEELAGHREVKITEDDSGSEIVLALGRIGPKSMERGAGKLGREVTLTVEDVNCELRGIIVNKQNRPEETGLDRVKALRLSHLNGSASTSTFARDSTDIDIDLFVPDADEVTMPAKFYGGVAPLDIIRECAEWEGKLFFVYTADNGDKELFYARPNDLTLHNCTLEVSDDPADINYTTVFPIAWIAGPALNMDPLETVTGVNFIHPDGQRTYDNDAAAEAIYDKWEESMFVDEGPGALADSHLAAVLTARKVEEVRRQGAIQLPGSKVHLIKPGMLLHIIQANAAAVPNVTGGSQKYRIAQIRYKWLGPDADDDNQYYVIVTLEVVRKLWRRWGAGKPGASAAPPTPTPAPQCETGSGLIEIADNTDGEWQGDPYTSLHCGPNFHRLGASGTGTSGSDFAVSPNTGYLLAMVIEANRHAYTVVTKYYNGDPDGAGVHLSSDTHSLGIIGTDNGVECPTPQITFTTPASTTHVRIQLNAKLGGWVYQAVFSEVGTSPENDPNCFDYDGQGLPNESPHYLPSDTIQEKLDQLEAAIDEVASDVGGTLLDYLEPEHRFRVSGHRGDIGSDDSYPENTLEGVRQTALKGANSSEIDVKRSSDGTWWLMHDTSVDRTTDGSGAVSSKTDAQMAALNIDGGFGYDAGRHGTSLDVPTLDSVVEAVRPYNFGLILHLVTGVAEAEYTALAEYIVENNLEDRVWVLCGLFAGAAAVKAVDSAIRTMTLTAVSDDPQTEPDIDIWLARDTELTALSDVTAKVPEQVWSIVSVDDYGDDEVPSIQDAWDFGCVAFMTNNLDVALRERARLLGQIAALIADGTIGDPTLAFDDLTDVTAPSPQTGELPRWNGSAWINDSGIILVDPGSIVVDDGTPFGITLTSVWGIDTGVPYYDDANAAAGEEAALFYDPLTDNYVLIAYDFAE